jgi:serum/glucocorticoid-regulated kinase 2
MLTGLPPYYSKDTNEMYRKILNDELEFPDYMQRQPLVTDLLIKLLAKDPSKRIKSCEDIKRHPWLIDVNWKKYMDKEI